MGGSGNWDESARVGTTACVRPRARGRRASREQGGLTGHGCPDRINQTRRPAGLRLQVDGDVQIWNPPTASKRDGCLVGGLVRCGSPTVTHGWDVVTNRAESPTNARAHGCSRLLLPSPNGSSRVFCRNYHKATSPDQNQSTHARTTGSLPVPGPVVGGDYVHFR